MERGYCPDKAVILGIPYSEINHKVFLTTLCNLKSTGTQNNCYFLINFESLYILLMKNENQIEIHIILLFSVLVEEEKGKRQINEKDFMMETNSFKQHFLSY